MKDYWIKWLACGVFVFLLMSWIAHNMTIPLMHYRIAGRVGEITALAFLFMSLLFITLVERKKLR